MSGVPAACQAKIAAQVRDRSAPEESAGARRGHLDAPSPGLGDIRLTNIVGCS